MNSLLAFSPILALVAFLSVEVAAETFTKYSALKDGGYVNGFDFEYTVNTDTPYTVSTTGDMGGCTAGELGTCSETPASWDNKNRTVEIVATIPAGVKFPEGMTPSFIEFKMCFAAASTVDRKWRKINDLFKKDNSCKNGMAVSRVDWAEGTVTPQDMMKLKSVTPTALVTLRAYVSCAGQGNSEYCHVVNFLGADAVSPGAGKVFFNTEVMESRPKNLFVAVIICALIGPLMLVAFLIYERGILAKQA